MATVSVEGKPYVAINLSIPEARALKDLVVFGANECDDEVFEQLEDLRKMLDLSDLERY